MLFFVYIVSIFPCLIYSPLCPYLVHCRDIENMCGPNDEGYLRGCTSLYIWLTELRFGHVHVFYIFMINISSFAADNIFEKKMKKEQRKMFFKVSIFVMGVCICWVLWMKKRGNWKIECLCGNKINFTYLWFPEMWGNLFIPWDPTMY